MHLWKECTLPERVWVVFFTVIYVWLFWLGSITLLTAATALLGSVCMFLGAKAKIANFYPGAIYTLLYAWQCYLYGFETVLYLHLFFHFPLQFVGLHAWKKHRTPYSTMQEDIAVRELFPHAWVAVLTGLLLATLFFSQVVYTLGQGQADLDILAFVFSIVAQLLMVGRFVEHWVAWLCLNVFNIGMWTYTAITVAPTYSIAFMWLIFMGNCAYGCYRWRCVGKRQSFTILGSYCMLKT